MQTKRYKCRMLCEWYRLAMITFADLKDEKRMLRLLRSQYEVCELKIRKERNLYCAATIVVYEEEGVRVLIDTLAGAVKGYVEEKETISCDLSFEEIDFLDDIFMKEYDRSTWQETFRDICAFDEGHDVVQIEL